MASSNGYEMVSLSPGWIKKKVPDAFNNDELKRIILFYVINTPCADLSSSAIPINDHGWEKNVWRKGKLREKLLCVANLKNGETFIPVKQTDKMKSALKSAKLSKWFQTNREVERIAMYKPSKYNDFLSICYHIRNAFAHGRLAMYPIKDSTDIVFALEDGVKKGAKFQVRSRMILKRSTLLKWIEIIEAGKLDG